MSLNLVHLVGRAGRDPETKYFESGLGQNGGGGR